MSDSMDRRMLDVLKCTNELLGLVAIELIISSPGNCKNGSAVKKIEEVSRVMNRSNDI